MNIVYKFLKSVSFLRRFRDPIIDLRDTFFSFSYSKSGISKEHLKKLKGRVGLEIGGPSWLWRSIIPAYRLSKRIDNFNRANKTIFGQEHVEGKGQFRYFFLKTGDQYISDNGFSIFPDSCYDFVLMCEVLEHLANPIKLLVEIRRLIKPGGLLIVVVPNKQGTFDYARPYTPFSHLLDDFINDVSETDQTHFQEAKDLIHDHREPSYTTRAELADLVEDNENTRFLHHHVFSDETIARVCSEAGFRVLGLSKSVFPEIIIIAEKYSDKNLRHKPAVELIRSYSVK